MVRWALLAVLVAPAPAAAQAQFEVRDAAGARWYRGNTHAHTSLTDGDSPPEQVVAWYRAHGYAFLVITDHDQVTDPARLAHLTDSAFVLIPGEEVTARYGTLPVHVNAIGLASGVAPQEAASVAATLQANVDAVRAAGGVPQANHPNFVWAVAEEDIFSARGLRVFELFNGHPLVNNFGGGGISGTEAAWDAILSSGVLLYGIAVDDAHHFKDLGNPRLAGPGRGWIMVRSTELTARAILAAMERGEFYASTGVTLTDYSVTARSMTVTVKKERYAKYRIQFIGPGGVVLHEALDSPATYGFKGTEGYVRARVLESNGGVAWCQPVWVRAQP